MITTNKPKDKRGKHFKHATTGQELWLYTIKSSEVYICCTSPGFLNTDDYLPFKTSELTEASKGFNKPINKVSESKKADDKIYNTLRKVFLDSKPVCELQLGGCTQKSSEVHHLFSGGSRSKYYLSVKEWKASCRNCHYIVHNILSKEQAIEMGLKKIDKKYPDVEDLMEQDLENIAEFGVSNNK